MKTLFLVLLLVVWWSYAGYPLVLYLLRKKEHAGQAYRKDFITVIVPAYNEERLMGRKMENLLRFSYPKDSMEIIVVNGGSTDRTGEIVANYAGENHNVTLINLKENVGKIYNINKGLESAKGDIIVISDVDSILSESALEVIGREMEDRRVGVVGLCTIPKAEGCFGAEFEYWVLNNKLKFLESQVDSAHCVAAPCYGFRRGLVKTFPPDVIADDFYTSLKVREMGYRVVYTPRAVATELRVPGDLGTMVRHKFRKAFASMHELRRFHLRLIGFSFFGAVIYPTKILHFFVTPLATILFLFYLYPVYRGHQPLFVTAMVLLGIFGVTNYYLLSKITHPQISRKGWGIPFQQALSLVVSTLVLLAALLLYPFVQRSSRYERI